MKVAVIGANGQLGSDICSEFSSSGNEVIKLLHDNIEISDLDSVSRVLKQAKANLIVNTAAMHNVEKCESDPAHSFAVNGIGARNLALVCNDLNSTLVHISTDYVFDGRKTAPYTEMDCVSPLNVYGNTKVSGEQFILSIANKYIIIRTSGIYGHKPCRAKGGLNFVELMLKLAKEKSEIRVVNDEFLTPTSTIDLARQIVKMTSCDGYGLYHATSEGSCSWFEFAKKIFELAGLSPNLKMASPGEFPMKVPRPKYSVLENEKLKKSGLNIFKPWDEALKEYLNSLTS
jgi:dTDP-4-dehydrorhamnose reductase